MIRIAIVEDEESYISVLKEYLERYKEESGEQIEVTVYHDGDDIRRSPASRSRSQSIMTATRSRRSTGLSSISS